jgi:uncharacterized protein with GYD domain
MYSTLVAVAAVNVVLGGYVVVAIFEGDDGGDDDRKMSVRKQD